MAWSRDVGLKERHDGDGLLEDLVLQQLGAEVGLLLPKLLDKADEVRGSSGGPIACTGYTYADERGK